MNTNRIFSSKNTLLVKGKVTDLTVPIIMGILNVTPDSFFDGNKYKTHEEIVARVQKMVLEGASIIDIGGYSTRPNANAISVQEEIDRVVPCITYLVNQFPDLIISVDTFRPEVAKYGLEAGASMINDVLAGGEDMHMIDLIAKHKVPYIMMHNVGSEQNMHITHQSKHIMVDMLRFFEQKVDYICKMGVSDIILDPGFGFSKSLDQNYEILKNLRYITNLNLPILVGLSRKSMIYKMIGTLPEQALNGTTALHMVALMNGANILRVHDVLQAKECIQLYNKLNKITG